MGKHAASASVQGQIKDVQTKGWGEEQPATGSGKKTPREPGVGGAFAHQGWGPGKIPTEPAARPPRVLGL